MLFQKKRLEQADIPATEPTLEWKELSRAGQSMWVAVSRWDYKVFPSMVGQRWGSWLLQFEGRANLGSLQGLTVAGDIEVLEAGEELGMLSDYWKNVPKRVEGYGFLMHEKGSPAVAASFGFTLYCKPEALDWVYRAFMCGLSSPHGGLGIDINISFPDPVEPEFWKERWRNEKWNVTSWKLFSGASRSAS